LHQAVARPPGIEPNHAQIALVRNKAEHAIQQRALAGAVRADKPQYAAFLDTQIDTIERDGWAECLAKTACFDRGHPFRTPLPVQKTAALAAPDRGVRSLRGSPATAPSEIDRAPLSATARARQCSQTSPILFVSPPPVRPRAAGRPSAR